MLIPEAIKTILGIECPTDVKYKLTAAGPFILFNYKHKNGAFTVHRFVEQEGAYVKFQSWQSFTRKQRTDYIVLLDSLGLTRNDIAQIMRCTPPTVSAYLKIAEDLCLIQKTETH